MQNVLQNQLKGTVVLLLSFCVLLFAIISTIQFVNVILMKGL